MGLFNKLEMLGDSDTMGDFVKLKSMVEKDEKLLESVKIENMRTDNDMVLGLTNRRILIADAKLVNATDIRIDLRDATVEIGGNFRRPVISINGTAFKIGSQSQAMSFKNAFDAAKRNC